VVFFTRRPTLTLLSFGLGFSSGVMVYISLVELLPSAAELMAAKLGKTAGGWVATGAFFGGMLVSAIIDKLVPDPENPHEAVALQDIRQAGKAQKTAPAELPRPAAERTASSVARLGPLTAVVIGLHNFPEGMATFASALANTSLGVTIAVAVAIHNIPEGIAVAVPTYFSTGSRNRALLHSFASGLAEPVGALLAYLVLMSILDETIVAGMLAAVAGIMVFISFDELVPTAREYGKGHTSIAGVVLGMAVMAVSLLLL
jgi:ZIP family zinc transporter